MALEIGREEERRPAGQHGRPSAEGQGRGRAPDRVSARPATHGWSALLAETRVCMAACGRRISAALPLASNRATKTPPAARMSSYRTRMIFVYLSSTGGDKAIIGVNGCISEYERPSCYRALLG